VQTLGDTTVDRVIGEWFRFEYANKGDVRSKADQILASQGKDNLLIVNPDYSDGISNQQRKELFLKSGRGDFKNILSIPTWTRSLFSWDEVLEFPSVLGLILLIG